LRPASALAILHCLSRGRRPHCDRTRRGRGDALFWCSRTDLGPVGMRPAYFDPLKALIFDWAGAPVDFACPAPVLCLKEIFLEHGIEVTGAEIRRDMGLLKRDHIHRILNQPRVSEAWTARHGSRPSDQDVERLFEDFARIQIARIDEHSELIPEAPAAVASIRSRGLRIGSTTGYTRPMLDPILARAAIEGYAPDASVTPDEAGAGRPAPWMCFQNMFRLQVFPPEACVKIGDTPSDIEEGLNAGMWTIGVVDSGNEVGLTLAEWSSLDERAKEDLRAPAEKKLRVAGAHYVVNSLTAIG